MNNPVSSTSIITFFAVIACLVVLAHVCGRIAVKLGQPAVVGEICCGVLFGPTLPFASVSGLLLNTQSRPIVNGVAQIGLAVFLYSIGTELGPKLGIRLGRKIGLTALGSIVVPLTAGTVLALGLLQNYGGGHQFAFVMFLAAAMSVTAFPVLARLLADRNMVSTDDGNTALTVAACTDICAWLLLAPVMAFMQTSGQTTPLWSLVLLLPYVAIMFGVVRPLSHRFPELWHSPAVALGVVCLSSATTEWLGLHFSIGAFLAGVVLSASAKSAARATTPRGISINTIGTVLAPLYFLLAGQQVDVSSFTWQLAGITAIIIGVASPLALSPASRW